MTTKATTSEVEGSLLATTAHFLMRRIAQLLVGAFVAYVVGGLIVASILRDALTLIETGDGWLLVVAALAFGGIRHWQRKSAS